MTTLLSETRARLTPARRSELAEKPPSWVFGSKIDSFRTLATTGRIVWGYVIECDPALTRPQRNDGSALLVHAADPNFDPLGTRIEGIALAIRGLKTQKTIAPENREVRLMLDKSLKAPQRTRVPVAIARDRLIYCASTTLRGRELPGAILTTPYVPILVHAELPQCDPLPLSCWAADLVRGWQELAAC